MKYRYQICVAPGILYDCIGDEALHLHRGDDVVAQCDRYEDIGRITRCHDAKPVDESKLNQLLGEEPEKGRRIQGQTMPVIIRRATMVDKSKTHESDVRGKSMLRTAMQKIQDHHLDMKVIHLHVVLDKSLMILQFTAEGRVDFRELLRDLSQTLHIRVELRQIGVRDETSLQGGLGNCGRPFCCAAFLHDFQSVNVKMAKEQGLSLNPVNISGACGRLKCCLRYESEGYRNLLQGMPRIGALCETPEGPGKVVDLMPLIRRVQVLLAPGPGESSVRAAVFPVAEVNVISADREEAAAETEQEPHQP